MHLGDMQDWALRQRCRAAGWACGRGAARLSALRLPLRWRAGRVAAHLETGRHAQGVCHHDLQCRFSVMGTPPDGPSWLYSAAHGALTQYSTIVNEEG